MSYTTEHLGYQRERVTKELISLLNHQGRELTRIHDRLVEWVKDEYPVDKAPVYTTGIIQSTGVKIDTLAIEAARYHDMIAVLEVMGHRAEGTTINARAATILDEAVIDKLTEHGLTKGISRERLASIVEVATEVTVAEASKEGVL